MHHVTITRHLDIQAYFILLFPLWKNSEHLSKLPVLSYPRVKLTQGEVYLNSHMFTHIVSNTVEISTYVPKSVSFQLLLLSLRIVVLEIWPGMLPVRFGITRVNKMMGEQMLVNKTPPTLTSFPGSLVCALPHSSKNICLSVHLGMFQVTIHKTEDLKFQLPSLCHCMEQR